MTWRGREKKFAPVKVVQKQTSFGGLNLRQSEWFTDKHDSGRASNSNSAIKRVAEVLERWVHSARKGCSCTCGPSLKAMTQWRKPFPRVYISLIQNNSFNRELLTFGLQYIRTRTSWGSYVSGDIGVSAWDCVAPTFDYIAMEMLKVICERVVKVVINNTRSNERHLNKADSSHRKFNENPFVDRLNIFTIETYMTFLVVGCWTIQIDFCLA